MSIDPEFEKLSTKYVATGECYRPENQRADNFLPACRPAISTRAALAWRSGEISSSIGRQSSGATTAPIGTQSALVSFSR